MEKYKYKETFLFQPTFDRQKARRYAKVGCKWCYGKGAIEGNSFPAGNVLLGAAFINYCDCVKKNVKEIVDYLNGTEGNNVLPEEKEENGQDF